MKKFILPGVISLLVLGWAARVYSINADLDLPQKIVYPLGEIVPIENDYFDYEFEDMDGYSVQVLRSELVSAKEFLDRYNAGDRLSELGPYSDYVYAVEITVTNTNNPYTNEKGIALLLYNLVGKNYILSIDNICFAISNPHMPGLSFSLQQNASKTILLPFIVMGWQNDYNNLLENPPMLQITQYPHQKMLEIA